jgi:hypothetical protein
MAPEEEEREEQEQALREENEGILEWVERLGAASVPVVPSRPTFGPDRSVTRRSVAAVEAISGDRASYLSDEVNTLRASLSEVQGQLAQQNRMTAMEERVTVEQHGGWRVAYPLAICCGMLAGIAGTVAAFVGATAGEDEVEPELPTPVQQQMVGVDYHSAITTA